MNIYFSFSVWKFSFSVSINGVVNNKKNFESGAAGRGLRCAEPEGGERTDDEV